MSRTEFREWTQTPWNTRRTSRWSGIHKRVLRQSDGVLMREWIHEEDRRLALDVGAHVKAKVRLSAGGFSQRFDFNMVKACIKGLAA
jgi:hypothetical protein